MNRILKTLATTTAAACVGVILVGAPTQAAPAHHESVAVVRGGHCHNRGVTNYYIHHWQRIHANKILNSPYVFREHRCRINGFRLYKSSANTAGEVAFQRHFLATDRPHKPTIFCRTTKDHAYFLDLGFYWGMANAPTLNAAEKHHYSSWAHDYARAHGCRLFVPKHVG